MKEKVRSFMIDFIWILIGCAIGAVAVVGIMEPNGLTCGGVVGIVRMLQNYVPLSFSVMYYIAAALVLLFLFFTLGFKAVRRAILVAVIYPTLSALFERFDISIVQDKDLVLAAIFCGVLQGVSIGLVSWRGYMFPATDGLAKAVRKKWLPYVSQSKIMSLMDASVIIVSAFVFDRNIALYALVTQVIISKTIDVVIYGFESQIVQLEVITHEEEAIADYVINEMHRSVTTTMVKGEYSGETYAEMRMLCSSREGIDLRKAIARLDPNAFVTLHRIDNVWGKGKNFSELS